MKHQANGFPVRRETPLTYAVAGALGLLGTAAIAYIVIFFFGMLVTAAPGGGQDAQQEAYDRLAAAHAAGDHAAVVEVYRGRVDVLLWPDTELYQMEDMMNYGPAPERLHLMVGDAYRHLGDGAQARRHYLKSLDWTAAQYETWCRLNDGCRPLDELARAGAGP